MASSADDADEGASPRATVLPAVAPSRLRMRPSFRQRPDPRVVRQYLRTFAHPSLRSGEKSREAPGRLAPSQLDRARVALRQMGTSADQQSLGHKELVFVQHKRRAALCLREDLRRWGIAEVQQGEDQRAWGDVPYEVARDLVERRRNRRPLDLWNLWPLPLQQLDQNWDEVYVDELPEVSDSFARPGALRRDILYTVFTKQWLTRRCPCMKTALGLPDIPSSASLLRVRRNPAEQLDPAIRAFGGGISHEPSL